MIPDSAHHSSWQIGEVVFGVPFLASTAIQFFFPFSLPPGIIRQVLIPVGIILMLTGAGIVVLARREFAHFNQPTDPGQPTTRIVDTGVFRFSRNPLYLASVLVFMGLALALNMLWALVMLLVSIVFCHYVLIIPEEQCLAEKFGQEYQEYTASVYRWLGRKWRQKRFLFGSKLHL